MTYGRSETIAEFVGEFEEGEVVDWLEAESLGRTLEGLIKVTHAARQLASGKWTSKLGRCEDIEHELTGLQCELYGAVCRVLQRSG